MAQRDHFELGSTYDFTTHAPSLLGTFKNAKVDGIVDHRIARNYIDPAAYHANIYGSLPVDTPDDHRRYYYVVVVLDSGETTAVGLPWIRDDSIELKERLKAYITLEDVSADAASRIRSALQSNGFTVANVEIG